MGWFYDKFNDPPKEIENGTPDLLTGYIRDYTIRTNYLLVKSVKRVTDG
jgi:hypothetical protein